MSIFMENVLRCGIQRRAFRSGRLPGSAAVALLLVLSFGRRNGPLRLPVRLPRSSPLEFAESMGRLYGKAGGTQAAVDGARRRLLKFLEEQCGVPREVLRSTPQAIVEAVEERLGGR